MDEALNNLLEQAKEYAAQQPDISRIVLDIERNSVVVKRKEVTPLDDNAASGAKVYQYMESIVDREVPNWEKDFKVWKFKHLDDVTEEELQERVAQELMFLMRSTFLQEDYLEPSASKQRRARLELENMGIEQTNSFVNRYTLLRDMVKLDQGRFVIKKATVGRYAQQVKDSLSFNAKKSFMRFATMLGFIYAELDTIGQARVEAEESTTLPEALGCKEAMKYWKRLQEKGFVDKQYMLCKGTTRQQATLIAEVFAEKLEIDAKWKTFQNLWSINNLAQEKSKRYQTGTMPSRSNEIEECFED